MTISRVEIKDYKKFGRKIVEWALIGDQAERPGGVQAPAAGYVEVPDRIKTLILRQHDLSELVISSRTKPWSRSRSSASTTRMRIIRSAVLFEKVCEDPATITNLDFLYSRIADYTISQCCESQAANSGRCRGTGNPACAIPSRSAARRCRGGSDDAAPMGDRSSVAAWETASLASPFRSDASARAPPDRAQMRSARVPRRQVRDQSPALTAASTHPA